MRWRGLAAATLLLLVSACAFHSSAPLFEIRQAVGPFENGERFEWREHESSRAFPVTYRIATYSRPGGVSYSLHTDEPQEGEAPIELLFIPVTQTEQDDFIVQVRMRPDEDGRIYAFMWRTSSGFRIIAAPGAVSETAAAESAIAAHCVTAPYGECQFTSRDDVVNFYLEGVYRAFVVGSATPADYIDQTPLTTTTRPGKS